MNEAGLQVLPESIHEWDEVKNSDTPEVFWDRIKNMRTKFGTGVFQPGEDAGSVQWGEFSKKAIELSKDRLIPRPDLEDEEQRKALYSALGVPDDAAGYEFAEIEGAPAHSDDRKKFLTDLALKVKLTKSQLKAMDEIVKGADFNMHTAAKTKFEDGLRDLGQEWGIVSDDRKNQALKIARTFFPHLGENPTLSSDEYRAFHSIAKQFGKGGTEFKEQGDKGTGMMSPADASIAIGEMRNNKDHPYNNPQSTGHQAAKKKMRNLYLAKQGQAPE